MKNYPEIIYADPLDNDFIPHDKNGKVLGEGTYHDWRDQNTVEYIRIDIIEKKQTAHKEALELLKKNFRFACDNLFKWEDEELPKDEQQVVFITKDGYPHIGTYYDGRLAKYFFCLHQKAQYNIEEIVQWIKFESVC